MAPPETLDHPDEQVDLAAAWRACARRVPDRTAVVAPDRMLRYAELEERSTALAHRLTSLGAGPERTVVLFTGRTSSLLVGIFGILKAGAAYLPVSPDHPGDRTRRLIATAEPVAVVTTRALADQAGGRSDIGDLPSVVVDEASPAGATASGGLPERSPSSLAYVLPTSGSTGEPKAVLIEDRHVLSLVRAMDQRLIGPFGTGLRIAMMAPYYFDGSVQQIFPSLLLGHTLVVVPEPARADGRALREFWAREAIDISDCTPTHLRLAVQAPDAPRVGVRHLIVGGDVLTKEVLSQFAESCAVPGTAITNIYGVAECGVASLAGDAQPLVDSDRIPVGVELPEAVVDLLDQQGQPVPDGEVGEIRISGPRVGRGYLDLPDQTAQRFGELPGTGGRYYRTGDLARRLPDGRLLFLGRADRQVKLRGNRIEPAEIEAALRGYRPGGDTPRTAVTGGPVACTRCLLTSAYPGVEVRDGVCTVCRKFDEYRHELARYFGDQQQLASLIRQRSTRDVSGYDVLLLFSGGKDSSYALYRLLDQGFRVLAFTFDNGYISPTAFRNIERITSNAGVELEIGEVPRMDEVFAESLRTDSTVCSGCFRGLTAMSTSLATDRGIGVVATGLSRGQIVDTKLRRLFEAQIYDPDEIDRRLVTHRKIYHARRDRTTTLLALPVVERSLDEVLFFDYFRYDGVTTAQIKEFLRSRDPFWAEPTDTGLCSTNCRINEVGIYVHSIERGYHNYAAPLSWDCRLGVLSREQGLTELAEAGGGEVDAILAKLGYTPEAGASPVRDAAVMLREDDGREPYLCAYYAAADELDPAALRTYLATRLPPFMIPSRFQRLDRLPMTNTGKVDYSALLRPTSPDPSTRTGTPPEGGTERQLAAIWADVLGIDRMTREADFFELGGDSLTATIVVGRAQDRFGVALSVTDLFSVPTVAHAAARVADAVTAGPPVTGAAAGAAGDRATELFLLPDVLGSVDGYRELVDRLGGRATALPGRSVLAAGDTHPEVDIAQLGAGYARRILGAAGQRTGIHLGGWSFGGVLALEVARQLREEGGSVDTLIVVDSMPPDPEYWGDLLGQVERFVRQDAVEVPPGLRRLLRPGTRPDRSSVVSYGRALLPVLRALSTHRVPDPVVPGLTCVRAADSELPGSAEAGWARLCAGEFRSVTVSGHHLSVLEPPHVDELVRLFATDRPGQPAPGEVVPA